MSRLTISEAIEHCNEKIDCSECGQQHAQLAEWLEELQRYKALEEQGRLTITEVGIGQTVWDIAIYLKGDGVRYSYGKRIVETKPMNVYQALAFSAKLGDTVFLTKEEAEAKLAELKGE